MKLEPRQKPPKVGVVKLKKKRITGWAAKCKEPGCRWVEGPGTLRDMRSAAVEHATTGHGWIPNQ